MRNMEIPKLDQIVEKLWDRTIITTTHNGFPVEVRTIFHRKDANANLYNGDKFVGVKYPEVKEPEYKDTSIKIHYGKLMAYSMIFYAGALFIPLMLMYSGNGIGMVPQMIIFGISAFNLITVMAISQNDSWMDGDYLVIRKSKEIVN